MKLIKKIFSLRIRAKPKLIGDYKKDTGIIYDSLREMPASWDGRKSVLELKDIDYQWRQMEWMGFYFEVLCKRYLKNANFKIPGEKYGNVEFDSFCSINWDMKASAIKSDNHRIILNDQKAIDKSLKDYGYHGVILALLDVDYNDDDRSFQRWHNELKGGLSKYEKERISRNATSRYRKTNALVKQILLLVIDRNNQGNLDIHRQGRNSDGSARNPKYMLNIEKAHHFEVDRIDF